ncbi:MAG: glycosyltransferase family 39 protein [Candidatus Shapirobacteria bacterium]
MKNRIYLFIVICIVVFGFGLRIFALEKSPSSLGFDEAALGYNAYSLLKTGKDEYGNFLPLSLRSFNDFKPALYAYLTVPFVYLFGLNGTAVRMVSAMAGVVSLVFLYLLLKQYIKNKYLVLVLFFVLSVQPYRLHFSRSAFETNLSAMFFCVGAYLLLVSRSKVKTILSVLCFALAAYSYHSARLSAPFLLILWMIDPIQILFKKTKFDWQKLIPLLGLVIICIPIFMMNNSSLLLTRFKQENVFNRFYPYAPQEVLNPLSFGYYFLGIISGHVFSYMSPINLNYRVYDWVKMSPQFIPGMGMLGWIEGVVFLFGFVFVIGNIFKSFKYRFLVYWMVAGIAPAAATWTWYHPLRSLNIFPVIEIIVALGAWQIWKRIKNKFLWGGLISIIMLVTMIFTINNELLYSPVENNGEYQPGGYKEGMPYFASISDKYSNVIIDTPHAQGFIFFLFYTKFDPATIQKYADIRPKPGTEGNLNFDFDKYMFRKVDWPNDYKLKNTLFWTRTDITDEEVNRVPGAKIEKRIWNVLYETASIITTE